MTPGETEGLRESFRSTSAGELDRESVSMRLWEKGKRLGTWNPADVDLERDAEQWGRLADDERDLLLRLSALFQAGEEAVTVDLLPLIRVIADEGRLEEEMYLAWFLWEEAEHVDAFRRFFEEVAHHDGDPCGGAPCADPRAAGEGLSPPARPGPPGTP